MSRSARDRFLALIQREAMRLYKNPSALMLIGLLVAFSILLVMSRQEKPGPMNCWIVYADGPPAAERNDSASRFIAELQERARESRTVRIVPASQVPSGVVTDAAGRRQRRSLYPSNTCAIELLQVPDGKTVPGANRLTVGYRHPGTKSEVLEPFQRWFWPIAVAHFGAVEVSERTPTASRPTSAAAVVMEKLQSGGLGELMNEDLAAAILLLIIEFVTCCQLIVSFTSQDRERGTLTALALSPVTMGELLRAKILFHLTLSLAGSAAVIAVLKPAALAHASLWITLVLTGLGLCSVGMVIASLTRTQSSASLLALCYMLIGAVIFYLATKFSAFATLKSFSFEHYSFGMVFLSLQRAIPVASANDLGPMLLLVASWFVIATVLFRQRGWR